MEGVESGPVEALPVANPYFQPASLDTFDCALGLPRWRTHLRIVLVLSWRLVLVFLRLCQSSKGCSLRDSDSLFLSLFIAGAASHPSVIMVEIAVVAGASSPPPLLPLPHPPRHARPRMSAQRHRLCPRGSKPRHRDG